MVLTISKIAHWVESALQKPYWEGEMRLFFLMKGSILLNINSQKFDNKEIGPLFLAPVLSSAFKIGMILAILNLLG